MKKTGIVVMDIGKSNAKLSLLDGSAGSLLHSETEATRSVEHPFYLHLDTDRVWCWYLQSLKRAQEIADITTICVTAHGAAAALIDDDELVLPVLDYECTGPDELAREYDALCDPFITTYSPKLPQGLNLGRQLYWQRAKFAEQFNQVRHVLPYPQYWTWRLTGIPATEVTTIGSHTDLWNPGEKRFSSFAQHQGFDKLFPPFKSAFDVLGPLRADICRQTGINCDCKVMVGVHDSNASLIPHLKSRAEPYTVMSTGTWAIIFAVGVPLSNLDPKRDCTANVNLHSEPIACARFMGGREFSAIAGADKVSAGESDLHRIIDNNMLALPAFAQAGGAFPNRKGCVTMLESLSPRERFALASVYCALLSDVSLGLCGSRGDIIVEGAYSRNPLLLSCLSALRPDQNILVSADSTGTTLGAAMLAIPAIPPPELTTAQAPSPELSKKLLHYRDCWHSRMAKTGTEPGRNNR